MVLGKILTKIFGSKYERDVKKYTPVVEEINEVYESLSSLSEDELVGKTEEFKERLRSGETLDDLMVEAFAVVKEACRRNVGESWDVTGHGWEWFMIPYDVQLIGAIALHEGKAVEMKTGEGKTLAATMPAYLNALTGKGVHIVTVNDYLARRDAQWMGGIYEYLGLTVGCIQSEMGPEERRSAYECDITYGTCSQFGFDYLRDNGIALHPEQCVQRDYNYAIVDEVDSLLIDEARTPLIISGPATQKKHYYHEYMPQVRSLFKAQSTQIAKMLSEAQRLLDEDGDKDERYEAGILLLLARMGLPKHKRYLKMTEEGWVKKLVEDVEMDFIREKKLGDLKEELFFTIDERSNVVELTEKGREKMSPRDPDLFILPDISTRLSEIMSDDTLSEEEKERKRLELSREYEEKTELLHNIHQLLKAFALFEKDVEYVVMEGRIVIVDQHTGRLMPSRRYSDGLHQALEAKENLTIQKETQTMATITIQNYFRMYDKLAGMTGTAETEARELYDIYDLDVAVIPTNDNIRRIDYDDVIFRTRREKYNAIVDEVKRQVEKNRPVLVGTISVDVSEVLSRMLKREGIEHSVLNAKHHQREAEIVAEAGEPGTVTIATNMAGRGTDIKLGESVVKCDICAIDPPEGRTPDHPEKKKKCEEDMPCGLAIIGTERHEARRIDRQLMGRSGRQGDPGSSIFFLSLEDDLMRLFGSDRIAGTMKNLGLEEGEAIRAKMITKVISSAQQRVEDAHFSMRKRVLEYDDVMNKQREVIYKLRSDTIRGENLRENIIEMIGAIVEEKLFTYCPEEMKREEWQLDEFFGWLLSRFPIDLSYDEVPEDHEEFYDLVMERIELAYDRREEEYDEETMRKMERVLILHTLDNAWKEHLYDMDLLREGIGLRGYGGQDPLIEYKKEAYQMFSDLMTRIEDQVAESIFRLRVDKSEEMRKEAEKETERYVLTRDAQVEEPVKRGRRVDTTADSDEPGRNDPCPCGSGKKYKKCCMKKKVK